MGLSWDFGLIILRSKASPAMVRVSENMTKLRVCRSWMGLSPKSRADILTKIKKNKKEVEEDIKDKATWRWDRCEHTGPDDGDRQSQANVC